MNVTQLANIFTGQANISPDLPVYLESDGRYIEVGQASLSALNTPDGLQSVITLHPITIQPEENNAVEDDDDTDDE